jgi:hypothetical protein
LRCSGGLIDGPQPGRVRIPTCVNVAVSRRRIAEDRRDQAATAPGQRRRSGRSSLAVAASTRRQTYPAVGPVPRTAATGSPARSNQAARHRPTHRAHVPDHRQDRTFLICGDPALSPAGAHARPPTVQPPRHALHRVSQSTRPGCYDQRRPMITRFRRADARVVTDRGLQPFVQPRRSAGADADRRPRAPDQGEMASTKDVPTTLNPLISSNTCHLFVQRSRACRKTHAPHRLVL